MANSNSSVSAQGGGGRGGSGFALGPAQNTFNGNGRAAAEAARDAYANANAAWLARYNADLLFWIQLTWTGGNYALQRRNAAGNGWEDVTNAIAGPRGPGPTANQVAAAVQAGVKAYARVGGPVVPESELDPSILRDSEVTKSFLLNILTLSAQELNDLFVGAVVSGAGAGRVITVTQADGSNVILAVPDTTGGGGGEGSSDGRVASGAFSADGTTLTLTLTTGGTVSISVPQALRNAGLSQSMVQALIDASVRGAVVIASSSTQIPDTAEGDTYVHTGSSNITYTLPRASGQGAVRDGFEIVISNQGAGDLTVDGFGGDTVDSRSTLVIDELGRTVRLQKIANSAWITIADTKDDTASGMGGTDQTARDAAAAAQNRANAAYTLAEGKQDPLTHAQAIDLLKFSVTPGIIHGYESADVPIDWRITVTPPVSSPDTWFTLILDGATTLAAPAPSTPGADLHRHKLSIADGVVYQFTLANTGRDNLATSRSSRRQGRDIHAELRFYDAISGGNLIGSILNTVDWLEGVATTSEVATAAATTPSPVIIVSNIASFDAVQNRFEDSSGDEVVVPDGSIVTLTQAVYDAAVADAQFTPNAKAIFLTR